MNTCKSALIGIDSENEGTVPPARNPDQTMNGKLLSISFVCLTLDIVTLNVSLPIWEQKKHAKTHDLHSIKE